MSRLTKWVNGEVWYYTKDDHFPAREMDGYESLIAMNKLAHYEDLEEQDRLAVLPCPLHSRIYKIDKFDGVVESVLNYVDIPKLGKTVFLTKEEAEEALKRLQGNE